MNFQNLVNIYFFFLCRKINTLCLWHEHQLHVEEEAVLSLFDCNQQLNAKVLTRKRTEIIFQILIKKKY